jgi:predicted nucleotidyltransferase
MKDQVINPENIPTKEEIEEYISTIENTYFHKNIIYNALNIVKSLSEVEAAFLMGSISEGTGDIFSDIDFFLMLEDGKDYSKVQESFLSEIDKLGEVIHIFQSNAKKNSTIIYLKPFIKFELVVESFSKLSAEWRIGKRGSLLYDKNGLGKEAIEESKKLEFEFEDHLDEIRNVALELPSFCFLIAGYMTREEYITTIDFVAWIRRKLLRISGFLLGIRDEGTRRAEQRFPKELVEFYNKCRVRKNDDVWDCLNMFLEWYSEWLVPHFENKNIIHAGEEVPVIKAAIKKLRNGHFH